MIITREFYGLRISLNIRELLSFYERVIVIWSHLHVDLRVSSRFLVFLSQTRPKGVIGKRKRRITRGRVNIVRVKLRVKVRVRVRNGVKVMVIFRVRVRILRCETEGKRKVRNNHSHLLRY